ncbi:MAG: asparagine synthase-related protein [Solirubrobacterales bacterium]
MEQRSGQDVLIGFDVDEFDETTSARDVARLYGAEHHEGVLDSTAMGALPRLVWHYGEPFADSSALATFSLRGIRGAARSRLL